MARLYLLFAAAAVLCAAPPAEDRFESKIRPLLAAKCYSCHTAAKMGGLRLDSRESILKGGARGAAVKPGDAAASLLMRAVKRESKDLMMPPSEALPAADVAELEKWIAEGAVWPQTRQTNESPAGAIRPEARRFWSFQPVKRPPVPVGKAERGNEIDRFLQAAIEKAGLTTAPAADRRTLIRRASLDLIGLPPTPEDVAAFTADHSPDAFAKVVDRLLGSPHYGERMARRWLDIARYADGRSAALRDDPLANAWRYRDWVVEAFNKDMPYDRFVTAQLAADLMDEPDRNKLLPALGFHALLDRDDDRVDITGRALLGLTVGCAQCHDHKFDPIPQSDYYSLQGVFDSTEVHEIPLAPESEVKAFQEATARVAAQKLKIDLFLEKLNGQLTEVLMERTADYLVAAWTVKTGAAGAVADVAKQASLDAAVLDRWIRYIDSAEREHPYLDEWVSFLKRGGGVEEARRLAGRFEQTLFSIRDEKQALDDRNYVKLGGAKGVRDQRTLLATNLEFLDPLKYYLWRDLTESPGRRQGFDHAAGVYYVDPKEVNRYLGGVWVDFLKREREEFARLQKAVPKPYPFLHAYRDASKLKDARIAIRGEKTNLGAVAPRRFLQILSEGEPERFRQGSGRLELARSITAPGNPLTARVMVNRLWQWRFGRGIVASASNFGQLGERPTHPELLDWLAAEFVDKGWSIKAIDRKIVLSAAYQRSSRIVPASQEKDAANSLLWRYPGLDRLDAETLRDAMLAVSGALDSRLGGPARPFHEKNNRRTLYAVVARTSPDRTMTLFDFPDPKSHSEERTVTVGPLQRLYFLNNPFVIRQAEALAARLELEAGADPRRRIERAFELVYSRPPAANEIDAALTFLQKEPMARYTQMLFAASEFFAVR
ncbi:MAG: PSD1 and planctomycete cytochrome C domain-containing protein [Bryobacteraceae bacterium]|nr:PSD1 and planctomycete cytochrome C domain-containing protein [Bryobacteraceae bacterium]